MHPLYYKKVSDQAECLAYPVKMATSTNAFSLPSVNLSSGQIGREVIQSPQNATRGMQLAQMAERLKNVSPTAARLLAQEKQ
jgi:hypothetical protein